jgi:hypothetical protein
MKVGQHRAAVRARHSGRRREGVGTVLHRGARLQRTSKDGREKCEQVEAAKTQAAMQTAIYPVQMRPTYLLRKLMTSFARFLVSWTPVQTKRIPCTKGSKACSAWRTCMRRPRARRAHHQRGPMLCRRTVGDSGTCPRAPTSSGSGTGPLNGMDA